MATNQKKFMEELLGDEFTKTALEEFGIKNSSPEMQVELLGRLGSCILQRLALEILTVLPKSEHEKFAEITTSNDVSALRELMAPYVPDVDEFISHYAASEYEAVKSQMKMVEAGVA